VILKLAVPLAALAIVLVGCVAADYVTEHGRVYECQATATTVLELCTQLSEDQLEQSTRWTCWPTTRMWPRAVGCTYSCDEDHIGCNATAGCFCPELR
jgi:hypothetical protein